MIDTDLNDKSNSELAEMFLQNVKSKKSKNTLIAYKREVNSFIDKINEISISDVKPLTISLWVSSRETGKILSDNTKRMMLSTIASFMEWLSRNGYVLKYGNAAKNEMADCKFGAGKQHEPLTLKQVRDIIRKTSSPREKCMLMILAKTGARINEVRSIMLGDIDLENGTIWIRNRKGSRNGSKDTIFPLDEELDQVIRTWLHFREANNEYLFVSYFGSWLSGQHVQRLIHQAGQRINTHITSHQFRYFFTTYMITEGRCPHPVVTCLRGDKNRDMTGYYTKPSPEYIRDEYLRAMPSLL